MKEFIAFAVLLAAAIHAHTAGALSTDIAAFAVFILVIGLLIYRDRKKVKLEGIMLIRRTRKGRDFIDRTANKSRRLWNFLGVLGVAVAILALVSGTIFLFSQSARILEGGKEGGVRLLLPGPVSSPQDLPGIFVVPWWIWVIGIAVVIIPHEFMHGIMCRLDKIRIKSVGWILLFIIPGAFVEPDEKQLKKAKRSTKMKVYAAGSFANIATALVMLAILFAWTSAAYSPAGIYAVPVENSSAAAANITGAITEIDGMPVKSREDLKNILSSHVPGDSVTIKTLGVASIGPSFRNSVNILTPDPVAIVNQSDGKTYDVALGANEQGAAFLGVAAAMPAVRYAYGLDFAAFQTITTLMLWIYIFSIGIGIVNILPIKPLDGGLLFEEITGKFFKKPQFIVKAVTLAVAFLLVFNLVGPLII